MSIAGNPIISPLFHSPFIYYLDSGVAFAAGIGNPEGVVIANRGSVLTTDTGVYWKSTEGGNTGWIALSTGGGSGASKFASAVASVSTSGTGLDQLQQITLPANSLAADGDSFRVWARGSTVAGGAGSQRWVARWDGSSVIDTGLVGLGEAAQWMIELFGTRRASGDIDISGEVKAYSNASLGAIVQFGDNTALAGQNFGIAHNLTILGENSDGADSITQRLMVGMRL